MSFAPERSGGQTLGGLGNQANVTTIKPDSATAGLGIGELWSYRELMYFLIWRDVKVRYRQTVFGALWALIQPIGLMLVFAGFLGRVGGLADEGIPYPLFALAGLVPWTFFAQGVGAASGSLADASNLLQKVYFPRLLLPLAAIGARLIDFMIAAAVLVVALIVAGHGPNANVIWVVPLTALMLVLTASLGTLLGALNVRYRDIRYAVPFLLQLWLFASPVVYSVRLVPGDWLTAYRLNPMSGIIEGFRWALLGGETFPLMAVASAVVVTAVLVVASLGYFRSVERTFADVI